jgi:hypothetical protein
MFQQQLHLSKYEASRQFCINLFQAYLLMKIYTSTAHSTLPLTHLATNFIQKKKENEDNNNNNEALVI